MYKDNHHTHCIVKTEQILFFFSIMIPRTSIVEANLHLQELHRRMYDLDITVQSQKDELVAKDRLAQVKLLDLATVKDKEIEGLTNKLLASERTVSVLQEELERKNQHIIALQNSQSKLKRILNFKDDLRDLLRTIEEAEDNLILEEGDTDGLLSCYNSLKDVVKTGSFNNALIGKKSKKKKSVKSDGKTVPNSDLETPATLAGKEFYL